MPRHSPIDFESICLKAAQGTGDGDPLIAPIVQSTTYCRDGIESAAPHTYSRQSNPTVAILEKALGQLENAPSAVCYSTGLAAELGLFLSFLHAGDQIVCSRALYGGTARMLEMVLDGFGLETDFVDTRDVSAVKAAIRENTKLVFLESPANPTLDLADISSISKLAHDHGALVAVDNTFLTAVLQQPLDLGADFSVYSTTKFIEGHSAALGGAVVSRDEERLERLQFVRTCTGSIQTPFHAWLTLQGMKTLPLRIRRQSETANAVADWLADHPATAVVHYPVAPGAMHAELAGEQHLGAHGAVLSFELVGGEQQARELVKNVKHCQLVEHVGSVETFLTHSASMTHGSVPKERREAIGVTDGLLRLSIGLEEPRTIIDDLKQAIESTAAKNA